MVEKNSCIIFSRAVSTRTGAPQVSIGIGTRAIWDPIGNNGGALGGGVGTLIKMEEDPVCRIRMREEKVENGTD